jgi:hypothetical protein
MRGSDFADERYRGLEPSDAMRHFALAHSVSLAPRSTPPQAFVK